MALTYSGLLLFCPQMGWGLGTQIPANIWSWTELVLLGAELDLNTATRPPVLWQQGIGQLSMTFLQRESSPRGTD